MIAETHTEIEERLLTAAFFHSLCQCTFPGAAYTAPGFLRSNAYAQHNDTVESHPEEEQHEDNHKQSNGPTDGDSVRQIQAV